MLLKNVCKKYVVFTPSFTFTLLSAFGVTSAVLPRRVDVHSSRVLSQFYTSHSTQIKPAATVKTSLSSKPSGQCYEM